MTDPLTAADVAATLDDPRHLGYGYNETRKHGMPTAKMAALDRAVAAVANELGLTAEALFHWSNSKHGRWLDDAIDGREEGPSLDTVRKHLNRRAVQEAMA